MTGGNSPSDTLREALGLHHAGRLAEAEAAYRKVLLSEPRNFDVLHFLGVLRAQRGDMAEAATLIGQALEINAGEPMVHFHLAGALLSLGRMDDALAGYERVIALKPYFLEAHIARIGILLNLGRNQDALDACDHALARAPHMPRLLNNRGKALLGLHRPEEAVDAFDRAIAEKPDYADAYYNRGHALLALNRKDDALDAYDRAVALKPDHAEALNNRGNTLAAMGRGTEALAAFDRALSLDPVFAKALYNRGCLLRSLGQLEEALADIEKALAREPDLGHVASERFHIAALLCDWRDRAASAADLARRVRAGQFLNPWLMLSALDDPEIQFLTARRFAEPVKPGQASWTPHQRLRIAYLSPDFHNHPTGYQTVELFERHDRTRFETFGVCLRPGPDSPVRQRLKRAFEHFVDAGARSDEEIAELLATLQIDIAVDLAGYVEQGRTKALSFHTVPVAVNYFGYPGTLGADYIDYIVADPRLITPETERFFSEKVVRLPDCYFPADTTDRDVVPTPSRAEAGLPEKGFVFCAFSNSYKLTPEMFDIWMRLLRDADGSVLWLIATNPAARKNLRAEAETRGIASARLIFAEWMEHAPHRARMALADLFLDSLPCNARATASDALWAGVPLVTCMGESFAARVVGSMLTAIGAEELIARDLAAYEAVARDLARSPERLAAVRDTIVRNRASRPLFDMTRLSRHLEAAYETMWELYRSGRKAESFSVKPSA